jgi:hypothetical protein
MLLFALPVSQAVAQSAAQNWILRYAPTGYADRSIQKTTIITEGENNLLYLFETATGFVLTSADDAATPILGYGFGSKISSPDANPAFQAYIQYRKAEMNQIKALNLENSSTLPVWQQAVQNSFDRNDTRSINPLLITTWNQGWPYNMYCPADAAGPGGRVYAGCVASAMAQVMKYWNWPVTGQGSHSYYAYGYGTQSANFGNTTYNWDQMPNSVGTPNEAVARLMYHAAVAVDMGFSPDGSGAYSDDAAAALRQNFRYNNALQMRDKDSYSNSGWEQLLRDELDDVHPMYYHGSGEGGGHAFVCDGYQNTSYFHFNWGWSGAYDGYFYLNNLNPGSSFNWGQGAIFDVHPVNYSLSSVRLSLQGTNCSVGDVSPLSIITYPVLPGWSVNNVSFNVEFDPDLVHYNGYDLTGTLLEGADVTANVQPGIISFTINTTNPIAGGGRLIKLNFQPLEPGNFAFFLSNFMFDTTAVTGISQTSVTVSSLVDLPQNSCIDLLNAMHVPHNQIATIPLTTTYVLPSWNVHNVSFLVSYQPEKVTWNSYDAAGTISENAEITVTNPSAGVLDFNLDFGTADLWGSGNLLKLNFLATGNTGSTTVATILPQEFYYGTTAIQNLSPGYIVLQATTANTDDVAPAVSSMSVSPNPFSHNTTISVTLPKAALTELNIYNLKGQLVRSMRQTNAKADFEQVWDGRDQQNLNAAPGIYFVKLQAGKEQATKRILKL